MSAHNLFLLGGIPLEIHSLKEESIAYRNFISLLFQAVEN